MSYECYGCGQVHDELPRFFMRRFPQRQDGRIIDADHEQPSMCRTDSQFFVRCEIEVPIIGEGFVLGYLCWVEVSPADYERLLRFRTGKGVRRPRSRTGRVRSKVRVKTPRPDARWSAKVRPCLASIPP